jgi:hypothetical protein
MPTWAAKIWKRHSQAWSHFLCLLKLISIFLVDILLGQAFIFIFVQTSFQLIQRYVKIYCVSDVILGFQTIYLYFRRPQAPVDFLLFPFPFSETYPIQSWMLQFWKVFSWNWRLYSCCFLPLQTLNQYCICLAPVSTWSSNPNSWSVGIFPGKIQKIRISDVFAQLWTKSWHLCWSKPLDQVFISAGDHWDQ